MRISKAAFACAVLLTSLIVILSDPAQAYDFSKPLSCRMVYGGGVMWTWADVSNGTANRVIFEWDSQSSYQRSRTRYDQGP
jgi:hypothetical protein